MRTRLVLGLVWCVIAASIAGCRVREITSLPTPAPRATGVASGLPTSAPRATSASTPLNASTPAAGATARAATPAAVSRVSTPASAATPSASGPISPPSPRAGVLPVSTAAGTLLPLATFTAPGVPAGATSRAATVAGTPPAAAPATTGAATTRPPLLVYADATGLWAADAGGPARALVQGTALFDPLISPDQTAVLYFHAVTPESRELWTVRTSGGNAHRLIAEDDLPQEGLPQGYTRRRIDSVQWIPGKQQLALTTVGVYGGQGPAPRLVSELWAVDANTGGLQPVLAQGALGGFAVSPDGARIAITRLDNNKDTLVVVNTDGSDARPLLEFPFVSGGGEAAFWPRPIWVTGNELLLAVPGPAAAFVPTETTALYRLRLDGSAQKLSEIRPLGLSNVLWSPDRRHLAYTRLPSPPQGATTYELVLANGDGSNEQVYATVRSGQVLSWAPDSTHFAYASEGRLYVGTLGGAPLPLTEAGSGTPGRAQWLAPQQVAYVLTSPGTAGSTSQLMLHTLGAPAQRAAQIQNPLPLVPEITFDVAPATGNGR